VNITEKPFKPSSPPKHGYNKTINPFPEYKNQGMKPSPTRHDKTDDDGKKKWKTSHNNNISHVTSSIICNQKNLKSEYSSILKS